MSSLESSNYLRNSVLQATQEKLQLMLFDGAIRFALQGREAIVARDPEATYEKLSRAQRIVLEMEAGLRPEVNREICEQMSALYNFVYGKLVNACVRRDVSEIDDALKILRHQRETWVLLIDKVAEARAEPTGASEEPTPAGALSVEG